MLEEFVVSMRKILGELAGWSPQRADKRIDRWLQNSGFRAWFLHESPAYFAACELIPERIAKRLVGPGRVELRARIIRAIELDGEDHDGFPDQDPTYDWEEARGRVAEILREYDR